MKNEHLANLWAAMDPVARYAWLKQLHDQDIVVSAEQLGVDPPELDAVAQEAGLSAVRKTVVDAAGMRDWEHGVQGPQFASAGKLRSWQNA